MKNNFIKLVILILAFSFNLSASAQFELEKESPSFKILGRKLTDNEKKMLGGTITEDLVRSQFLHREHKLVAVRSLVALGVPPSKDLLSELYFEIDKSYEELVTYLNELKEKYGSVKKGLEERNYSKDKESIFRSTVASAYKEVYGEQIENAYNPQNLEKLFTYLKSKEAIHYSEITSIFVDEMTDKEKITILDNILIRINRKDLQKNTKFRNTILNQQFTYDDLYRLLRQAS